MAIIESKPEREKAQSERERRREQELKDAVERVYRHYGTDISAFFRDAHKEAQELEKRAR